MYVCRNQWWTPKVERRLERDGSGSVGGAHADGVTVGVTPVRSRVPRRRKFRSVRFAFDRSHGRIGCAEVADRGWSCAGVGCKSSQCTQHMTNQPLTGARD